MNRQSKGNQPKYKVQKAKYGKEHQEQARLSSAKWYMSHKEKANKEASNWQRNNKDKVKAIKRKTDLKTKYGMSVEDFDSMSASQGFACAICKIIPTATLHVDHDHQTGKVRGLLCSKCNTALGLLKDSTEFLARAITYLSI